MANITINDNPPSENGRCAETLVAKHQRLDVEKQYRQESCSTKDELDNHHARFHGAFPVLASMVHREYFQTKTEDVQDLQVLQFLGVRPGWAHNFNGFVG